ncbi:MAG: cytochrome-c oxidase, cbb3-type subunit III [Alphaproteobacteria bacterium]|nr:cytochrome-c oxidase, cbb3-type subunit III [Alphaproteobacteria bacterium]
MTDHSPEIDNHSGVETTGHEWDGIRELNNPLPRWWLYLFYACIAFAFGYWVLMPAWPGLPGMSGATPGILHASDRAKVAGELSALARDRAALSAKLATLDAASILKDPQLRQQALALGESTFGDNCATCHGPGGRGGKGYPRLADDVWLWGGSLADIEQTIRYGVRSGNPKARVIDMPAFGRDEFLKPAQIDDLVEYVMHLSGQPADEAAVARASQVFIDNCKTCHGAAGTGDRSRGVPNLTDADWLYGGDRATIRRTIFGPRGGVMPAWGDRFDPATVRALAIYVHSLGGGE